MFQFIIRDFLWNYYLPVNPIFLIFFQITLMITVVIINIFFTELLSLTEFYWTTEFILSQLITFFLDQYHHFYKVHVLQKKIITVRFQLCILNT